MIPPGVERRLRGHVDRVLRTAHVPATERESVADELTGHLVERWQSLVRDGLDEAAATERAIRDFGTADRIGRDLTRTYHGRLWASTIGVLLPAAVPRAPQPRIARWLGVSLRFYAVFAGLATALIVGGLSPVAATFWLAFGLASTALMVLAAMALRRRQRWALDLAIVVNVIGLLYGLYHMLTTPGLFSLNVVFSGLVLAIALTQRDRLGLWVRRSRPIRNGHAVAIFVVILGGSLAPAAARELPDPTQAGPDDLHVTLAVDCGDRVTTVTADVRWDRVSFLPGGLANLDQYGDLLLLENSPNDRWEYDSYPTLVDLATGRVVAEPDEWYAPNEARLEAFEGPASAPIQINWNALEPGRTYRATWELRRFSAPDVDTTFAASVEYLHADQFRWEQLVDCMGGRHEPIVSDWP